MGWVSPLLLVIDWIVFYFSMGCVNLSFVIIMAARSILVRLRHCTVVHLKVEFVVTDLKVSSKFLIFAVGGLDHNLYVVRFVHVYCYTFGAVFLWFWNAPLQ